MAAPYYCLPHSPPLFVGHAASLPSSSSPLANWGNNYPHNHPAAQSPSGRLPSNTYVSEATHTSFFLPDQAPPPSHNHISQSFPSSSYFPPNIAVIPPDPNGPVGQSPQTIDQTFYPPLDVDPAFLPPQVTSPTLSPLAIPGSVPQQHHGAASTPFVYPQALHQPIPYHSNPGPTVIQMNIQSPPPNHSTLFGGTPGPIVDPSPIPTLSSPLVGGQHGINHLLNCTPGEHPYIDWLIYQDTTTARRWVLNSSGIERPRSINSSRLAVVPPIDSLQISTKDWDNPLGHALRRWGPVQVHRTNHPITVGDVMHEIWAYFQHPLTEQELGTMEVENPYFAEQTEESCERRCKEQGLPPHGVRVRRRCDTLFDCLRFATMEIDYEFARTKTLFLSVDRRDGS